MKSYIRGILLVGAASLIAVAANAAKDSADASKAQAAVAKTALENAQRPYVYVSGVVHLLLDSDGGFPFVEYIVANHGQTPAIVLEARDDFFIIEGTEVAMPGTVSQDHILFRAPIIGPGESVEAKAFNIGIDYANWGKSVPVAYASLQLIGRDEDSRAAEARFDLKYDLFFRVVVRYRGPFTSGHETSACWRYNKREDFFESAGSETNYEK